MNNTLVDPRTQRKFFQQRKKNNKLRANREVEKEQYQKLSEKSGISPITLKNAAYGRDDSAFMDVASNESLSNTDKNLILSGAVGKFNKETTSKSLPTFKMTTKWKTPVRERDSVCAPITGWSNHKKVTVLGGGQKTREHIKKAKSTNVDFSDVNSNTSYSDLVAKSVLPVSVGQLAVEPVRASSYLNFFKSGGNIHIKKKNRGKFTDYCGGKVTEECIQRGKHSSNPTTRKRANFAANARTWKHQTGGELIINNKSLYSREKVGDSEIKRYTQYLPQETTTVTQETTTTPTTVSYDLRGYNIPTSSSQASSTPAHEGLHSDITKLLDLFNKYGLKIRVTSGYREGATTKQGNKSHHASGMAIDIVPEDGDFSKLAKTIRETPEIKNYMISKGLGVLDETTQEMLARTGGTGAHYHIGPDRIAQNFWTT